MSGSVREIGQEEGTPPSQLAPWVVPGGFIRGLFGRTGLKRRELQGGGVDSGDV